MGTDSLVKGILDAKDYRQLNEWERKILVQMFINTIHYDPKKFQKVVRILNNSNNKNS